MRVHRRRVLVHRAHLIRVRAAALLPNCRLMIALRVLSILVRAAGVLHVPERLLLPLLLLRELLRGERVVHPRRARVRLVLLEHLDVLWVHLHAVPRPAARGRASMSGSGRGGMVSLLRRVILWLAGVFVGRSERRLEVRVRVVRASAWRCTRARPTTSGMGRGTRARRRLVAWWGHQVVHVRCVVAGPVGMLAVGVVVRGVRLEKRATYRQRIVCLNLLLSDVPL